MAGLATVTKLAGETVGQEFLIFTLGDEEYGIDILKVQEIRGYDQVTRIANTPTFIKGVTNLRGVIVPIIDLRVKFAQSGVSYNENTVVIVLNFDQRVVGIVVDAAQAVLANEAVHAPGGYFHAVAGDRQGQRQQIKVIKVVFLRLPVLRNFRIVVIRPRPEARQPHLVIPAAHQRRTDGYTGGILTIYRTPASHITGQKLRLHTHAHLYISPGHEPVNVRMPDAKIL